MKEAIQSKWIFELREQNETDVPIFAIVGPEQKHRLDDQQLNIDIV